MQDTVNQMSESLGNKWNSLSKGKKVTIGAVSVAVVLAMGISAYMFSRPEMEILYRNIDIQTVADITDVLDKEKISYVLSDEGKTISLEEQDINKAKILLTKEDIPKGKYTFEDALSNTMSTTESEKQAKLHRLKETDLETALEYIEGVSLADVTLVIPEEKNSFISSKSESSASVVLTLDRQLTSKQIEGIVRFITSSVENLKTENIGIIDSEGNALYSSDSESNYASSKQQELRKEIETDIVKKIEGLLKLSYDEVRVAPNLVLNFDQYAEVVEEYTPQFQDDPRGLISTETIEESSSSNASTGGEPGTATNGGTSTTYQVGEGTTGQNTSNSSQTVYVNDKKVSNFTKNSGTVDFEKSSIAVNVTTNKIYYQSLVEKEGSNWEEFKLTNGNKVSIKVEDSVIESIANATGIEKVSVQGYEVPIFIDNNTVSTEKESNNNIIVAIGAIIGTLAITIILFLFLRKKKTKQEKEEISTLEEIAILQGKKEEETLEEIELKEGLQTKIKISKFIDEKPDVVANLLRNWISDSEWDD